MDLHPGALTTVATSLISLGIRVLPVGARHTASQAADERRDTARRRGEAEFDDRARDTRLEHQKRADGGFAAGHVQRKSA